MIKTISDKIHQLSTGWAALITTLIMVLFMIFVLPGQSEKAANETGSSQSPDTSFFYTAEDLYMFADEYGQEGRQAYIKTRWSFDLIYPLVYTFFLTAGIGWFFRFLPDWQDLWKLGILLPILGGIFDYLENILSTWVMSIYPTRLAGLAQLTAYTSITKWLLISLAFLIYFIFGLGAVYAWIKQKRT